MTFPYANYINLFPSLDEAIEFENQTLSMSDHLLPDCALRVLNDGEPTDEYWEWLASQVDTPETDAGFITQTTATIEAFLDDWDRHEWMRDHGTWASETWDDARNAYREAWDALESELAEVNDPEYAGDSGHLDDALAALERLKDASDALEHQVRVDDHDYPAEGVIDPDGVATRAAEFGGIGECWSGWDCREGWLALRVGDDLYLNWYRRAQGERHERDLYVLVKKGYFA